MSIEIKSNEVGYNINKSINALTNGVGSLLQLSNRMLVSSGNRDDKTIKVWDPKNNYSLVRTLTWEADWVENVDSLLQLSNGMLVSGSQTIRVWYPINNYSLVTKLTGHQFLFVSSFNSQIECLYPEVIIPSESGIQLTTTLL